MCIYFTVNILYIFMSRDFYIFLHIWITYIQMHKHT